MDKPQPKREVAIRIANKGHYLISFYATPDALEDFKSFGGFAQDMGLASAYVLFVDPRLDFDEVLAYIENYGKEDSDG